MATQSGLKTGVRPQQSLRNFKKDEVLFEENSRGRELYVIQEGRVGIYKDTSEGRMELAIIEKGGVIGEMSLLDNLPRSATVIALENTQAVVINQSAFNQTLQQMPQWLVSIIKIVVSRLRDVNKRIGQSVLRDKNRGLAALILLLLPVYKKEVGTSVLLDFDLLLSEAFYVSRLRRKEVKLLLSQLEAREIISLEETDDHRAKNIVIKDFEVLKLYEEYLGLLGQRKTFKEFSLPEDSLALFSNIAYVAQKSGRETEEGTTLKKSVLLQDLSEKSPDKLENKLLDLRRRGLINIMPEGSDFVILFSKETLGRIKKIKEWLPKFELEMK